MRTKILTIMMTDIKGFTDKTARKSRSEMMAMLEKHEELILPILESHGGRLVKTIGDAFLVTFLSATDAVLSGVAVQDRLCEYNRDKTEKDRIDIRIAINSGEVTVTDNDVFGESVNITARLESIAEAGEVFFTEAVYLAMNKREVPSSEIGYRQFKGIPEQIKVYKVVKEKPLESAKRQEPAGTLPAATAAAESPETGPEGDEQANGESPYPSPVFQRLLAIFVDVLLVMLVMKILIVGAQYGAAAGPGEQPTDETGAATTARNEQETVTGKIPTVTGKTPTVTGGSVTVRESVEVREIVNEIRENGQHIKSQVPVTFKAEGDPLPDVIRDLARQAGINTVITEEVTGKVTLSMRDAPLGDVLDVVVKSRGFDYVWTSDSIIMVSTRERVAEMIKDKQIKENKPASASVTMHMDESGVPGIEIIMEDQPGDPRTIESEITLIRDEDIGAGESGDAGGTGSPEERDGGVSWFRQPVVLFIVWILYGGIFITVKEATPGKMLARLRVVRFPGDSRAGFWRALFRSAVVFFFITGVFYMRHYRVLFHPWTELVILVPIIALVGLSWALWQKDRRCWHDFLAGTMVIGDGKPYEFIYEFHLSNMSEDGPGKPDIPRR